MKPSITGIFSIKPSISSGLAVHRLDNVVTKPSLLEKIQGGTLLGEEIVYDQDIPYDDIVFYDGVSLKDGYKPSIRDSKIKPTGSVL